MFRAEVLDLRREVSRGARLVQPALEVAMYSFGPADRVISFRSILSASLVDWHDGFAVHANPPHALAPVEF